MTLALPLEGLVAFARHLGYGASPGCSIDAGELVRSQSFDVQKPMPLPVDMPAKGELLGNQPASLAGGHAPRAAGLAPCNISEGKSVAPAAPAFVYVCVLLFLGLVFGLGHPPYTKTVPRKQEPRQSQDSPR